MNVYNCPISLAVHFEIFDALTKLQYFAFRINMQEYVCVLIVTCLPVFCNFLLFKSEF